jgi:hypothetical protein
LSYATSSAIVDNEIDCPMVQRAYQGLGNCRLELWTTMLENTMNSKRAVKERDGTQEKRTAPGSAIDLDFEESLILGILAAILEPKARRKRKKNIRPSR